MVLDFPDPETLPYLETGGTKVQVYDVQLGGTLHMGVAAGGPFGSRLFSYLRFSASR